MRAAVQPLNSEVQVDRRDSTRHRTILRVGVLSRGHKTQYCLVRNLSSAGALATVYCPFELDDEVTIEISPGAPVQGRIVRVEDRTVAIQFAHLIDVDELLSSLPLPSHWSPRKPRVSVDRMGTLRCGASVYFAQTLNISLEGVQLHVGAPIEEGAEVVVNIEGLAPIAGVVRWQDGENCGIQFNDTLSAEYLTRWLALYFTPELAP